MPDCISTLRRKQPTQLCGKMIVTSCVYSWSNLCRKTGDAFSQDWIAVSEIGDIELQLCDSLQIDLA
jgi:hypothetical protein